jgi:hypothetical protein
MIPQVIDFLLGYRPATRRVREPPCVLRNLRQALGKRPFLPLERAFQSFDYGLSHSDPPAVGKPTGKLSGTVIADMERHGAACICRKLSCVE